MTIEVNTERNLVHG